jgi:replicative DNA helicase
LIEIENAFLGSLIEKPDNLDNMIEVGRDWFLGTNNRIVFDAIRSLYLNGKAVDRLTVTSFIDQTFKKDFTKHIGEILSGEYNSANFPAYQEELADRHLKTAMINCLNESKVKIENAAYGSVRLAIDAAEGEIFRASQIGGASVTISKMGDVGIRVMKDLKDMRENGKTPYIAFTGLIDLDKHIGGFSAGDLVVVAGRPSMGKTAFALQLARNNLIKGVPVGFVSLETKSERIYLRHLSAESNINSLRIRSGEFTSREFDIMTSAWKRINALSFYVDDASPMNEVTLRASARRMVTTYGVKMIIVDYIQMLESSKASESRQQEITKISRSLKNIAKELSIPVIALSQLSRRVEERKPPRPMLSDLRESGSIEQDADIVLFIYRPDYYGISKYEDGSITTGISEIIIGKARDGEVGTCKTLFINNRGVFENFAREELINNIS